MTERPKWEDVAEQVLACRPGKAGETIAAALRDAYNAGLEAAKTAVWKYVPGDTSNIGNCLISDIEALKEQPPSTP